MNEELTPYVISRNGRPSSLVLHSSFGKRRPIRGEGFGRHLRIIIAIDLLSWVALALLIAAGWWLINFIRHQLGG